jgi:hypothetical protein
MELKRLIWDTVQEEVMRSMGMGNAGRPEGG